MLLLARLGSVLSTGERQLVTNDALVNSDGTVAADLDLLRRGC